MTGIISPEAWRQELNTRRTAVWQVVQEQGCDLLLVYGGFGHAEPFRYLTNFTPVLGDAWAIVRAADAMTCVLNFNWQLVEARNFSGVDEWYGIFNPVPKVAELLKGANPKRVGVVGLHRLPSLSYDAIKAALPNAEFVDIGAPVAVLRRSKSPLEIALLKEACRITDSAFDAIRAEIKPGMTEQEVAARLTYLMTYQGARLSFEPTVVSGIDDPIAIRLPTDRKLQAGDSVMMDIGAEYQGYQADATRTFVLGEPNAKQLEIWGIIQQAYRAAFDAIRPGAPCNAMHKAAIGVIEGAGYSIPHRVGHGIGLATSFEYPSMDTETAPMIEGMTFCVEPGIYTPGAGNMKLEDDVLVTATDYELLTHSSPELVVDI